MITAVLLLAVLAVVVMALARLRLDDGAARRLERNEYRALVKHLWFH